MYRKYPHISKEIVDKNPLKFILHKNMTNGKSKTTKFFLKDNMNKSVISVLGQDRPGIIAAVTATLFKLDCNIENIDQTILQSEFSGIFIVSIPSGITNDELCSQLTKALDYLNLRVFVKPLEHKDETFESAGCEPFIITTIGPDRKGLVAGITEIIAKHGVNVTNLKAVFKGGDNPNDNIMIYEVDIPDSVDHQILRKDLIKRASKLGLDISIQHRNIFMSINRI
jgi:glycine cleavage system transcriptional repressor